MVATPHRKGDFTNFHEQGSALLHINPKPPPTMNPTPSHTQPFSPSHDELRIRDYAMASALVVGACASIAIGFTLIGTCYAADAAFKRIFRKGGRHDVPR